MVKNIPPCGEQSLPYRVSNYSGIRKDRAIRSMHIVIASDLSVSRKNEIILVPEIPDAGKYHRHVQVVCCRNHFGIAN